MTGIPQYPHSWFYSFLDGCVRAFLRQLRNDRHPGRATLLNERNDNGRVEQTITIKHKSNILRSLFCFSQPSTAFSPMPASGGLFDKESVSKG